MKARVPTPLERLNIQRTKGREVITTLRNQGLSEEEIAKKLGVPYEKWKKFLWQIGMIKPNPNDKYGFKT